MRLLRLKGLLPGALDSGRILREHLTGGCNDDVDRLSGGKVCKQILTGGQSCVARLRGVYLPLTELHLPVLLRRHLCLPELWLLILCLCTGRHEDDEGGDNRY